MSALRRVASAPGLVIFLWLAQLAVAWQLGDAVAAATISSMKGYAWLDDGHLLFAISELMAQNPAVAAAIVHTWMMGAIFAITFWALAYGGVISRLDGKKPASELAAASIRFAPSIAAQTIYVGIVRAIPMAGIGAMAAKLPVVAFVLGAVVLAVTVTAADVARVSVVLHGERRFHVKTALRAIRTVVARPRLLGMAGTLALVQAMIPALLVYLVISDGAGSGSIWLARGLTLAGLVLGLWRISVVIDALGDD
jgi:hypothetical protein